MLRMEGGGAFELMWWGLAWRLTRDTRAGAARWSLAPLRASAGRQRHREQSSDECHSA